MKMKKQRMMFIALLISSFSLHASDSLIDLENVDTQFFEQAISADNPINLQINPFIITNEDDDLISESGYSDPEESGLRFDDIDDDLLSDEEETTYSNSPLPISEISNEIENELTDDFSPADYRYYMDLICSTSKKKGALAKATLKACAKAYSKPCLLKANPQRQAAVLPPTKESLGYPILILPALKNWPEKTRKAHLISIVNTYNSLTDREKIEIYQKTNEFPTAEYEHYMSLIEQSSPDTYQALKKCEKTLSKPCLLQGNIPVTLPPTEESKGYPIVIMQQLDTKDSDATKTILLNIALQSYTEQIPLAEEDRIHILSIIKSLAPELYTKIVAVDPTGIHHISPGDRTSVSPLLQDGLPIFRIDPELLHQSIEEQRWVLGHELGHYVLEHFKKHTVYHSTMNPKDDSESSQGENLAFKEAFEKTYSRIQEYEADKFSVMNLGTTIDGALKWLQQHLLKRDSKPSQKETFQRTHPPTKQRIEHIESLRPEVELQKARGGILQKIDWDALIQHYKKGSWEEMQESL